MSFDAERARKDFPILSRPVHGSQRLAYLDSAATSQRPPARAGAEWTASDLPWRCRANI